MPVYKVCETEINAEKSGYMSNRRPRRLYVVGGELDIDLILSLDTGDKVLMEVNGARTISSCSCPLVAEEPWVVVANRFDRLTPFGYDNQGKLTGGLVLKHPSSNKLFTLSYEHMIYTRKGDPAVFVEENPEIGPGQLYVILQFVAYRLAEDRVNEEFPVRTQDERNEFAYLLKDPVLKEQIITSWGRKLKHALLPDSWRHRGILRMALRTGVMVSDIQSLINQDERLHMISDDVFLRLREEAHWLPKFLKQSDYIQHDVDREYTK